MKKAGAGGRERRLGLRQGRGRVWGNGKGWVGARGGGGKGTQAKARARARVRARDANGPRNLRGMLRVSPADGWTTTRLSMRLSGERKDGKGVGRRGQWGRAGQNSERAVCPVARNLLLALLLVVERPTPCPSLGRSRHALIHVARSPRHVAMDSSRVARDTSFPSSLPTCPTLRCSRRFPMSLSTCPFSPPTLTRPYVAIDSSLCGYGRFPSVSHSPSPCCFNS